MTATDLDSRISAHPVASAMEEYMEAIADGCRSSVCSSDKERMAAAEFDLDVALLDDTDREANATASALRTVAANPTATAISGWLLVVASRVECGASIDDALKGDR